MAAAVGVGEAGGCAGGPGDVPTEDQSLKRGRNLFVKQEGGAMRGRMVRMAAGVMLVMGAFLVVVGLVFGEWSRAVQGMLFVVLGVYFWRWRGEG